MTADEVLQSIKFSDLTPEQIDAIESGNGTRILEALRSPDQPGKPSETPPAAAPAAPPALETPESKLDRMSLKALKDRSDREKLVQLVQGIKDGKYASLEAAAQAMFGSAPPAAPVAGDPGTPAAAPAAAEAPVFVDDALTVLESSIEELNVELQEAKRLYDYDKQGEIVGKMADLKVELALAKRDSEARKASFDAFVAAETESRQNVLSRYGELLTDPESQFSAFVDAEIVIAERKNDPILSEPDWPEKIAEKVFQRLYPQTPGSAQLPPPVVPAQIPPAPPGLRFPGSPVAGAAAPVALSVNDALEQMDKMSPEERLEVLALAEKSMQASRR